MAPDFISAVTEPHTQLGFQGRGQDTPLNLECRVLPPTSPPNSAAFVWGEALAGRMRSYLGGRGCLPHHGPGNGARSSQTPHSPLPEGVVEVETPQVRNPDRFRGLGQGLWGWGLQGSQEGLGTHPIDHPDSTPCPLFSVYDLESWSTGFLSTAVVCSGLN